MGELFREHSFHMENQNYNSLNYKLEQKLSCLELDDKKQSKYLYITPKKYKK